MEINGRKIAIFAASTVAGMAAGTVTSMLLKQNTEAVKVSEKVARVVGSVVIGAMVQEKAEQYISATCNNIFDIFDGVKNISKKVEAAKEVTDEESE